MSDQPIHPDSVELTDEEAAATFTRYWTDGRLQRAKRLAKQLTHTSFDAVEDDGLRAEAKPEGVVVVTPTRGDERYVGLPEPERPEVHISTGTVAEDHLRVFKLRDNSHYPDEE